MFISDFFPQEGIPKTKLLGIETVSHSVASMRGIFGIIAEIDDDLFFNHYRQKKADLYIFGRRGKAPLGQEVKIEGSR